MAKFGKWIGAGLGFAMGGPLGAILGFVIGSSIDGIQVTTTNGQRPPFNAGRNDFLACFTVLAVAVMKADGVMTRGELEYVKAMFVQNFGKEATNDALKMMQELKDKEIPLNDVCTQIRYNMDDAQRRQLLYFLFGIAKVDGVCSAELNILSSIAARLGIDGVTFNSMKAMFYDNEMDELTAAYQTLGIDSSATDVEVKKAYRKMAVENHPDKVGHLGEDIRKAAEEKFTRINAAYEKIKKQRGIS